MYNCSMVSKVINLRIDERLIEEMDDLMKDGLYTSRSDFIKNSIRKEAIAQRKYAALKLFEKYKGHGKNKKIKSLKKARELAWDALK